MKTRKVTYRLCVFATDSDDADYHVEADTAFSAFHVGDYIRSENVAGFANETFVGVVRQVVHHMYAASEDSFVHQTMIYLDKSDWWEKGAHRRIAQ